MRSTKVFVRKTCRVTINWPEVILGGTLFFVVGVLFQLFLQPRIERGLTKRRQQKQLEREEADGLFAARVDQMAYSPDLFAATYREGVARIILLLVSAMFAVLVGLLFQAVYLEILNLLALIPYAVAVGLIAPAAAIVRNLQDLAGGVRQALLVQLGTPAGPRIEGASDSVDPLLFARRHNDGDHGVDATGGP